MSFSSAPFHLFFSTQQLPATIFNISGRNTKYDRCLFQRLEEAGHDVHLLDTQYRMHPAISNFPRQIFYSGLLLDGPNVKHPEYGNPLKRSVFRKFQSFKVGFEDNGCCHCIANHGLLTTFCINNP